MAGALWLFARGAFFGGAILKAVLCKAFGPPESLVLEEVPDPVAGDEDLLIDVKAAALNFPDVLMIAGKYQSQPAFPFSPGGEIAGTVLSAGAKVTEFAPGDQVFGATWFGGLAERTVAPAAKLMRKPASMSFAEAAGVTTTYGTSYYALKDRANLRPGENLLVLGAAGGVGIAAVQIGKALGARVINHNRAEFPASTTNSNTHCTGCVKCFCCDTCTCARDQKSVLAGNSALTTGFHWSYILLL